MNNIDLSQLITAEDKARALIPDRVTRRQFKLQLAVQGLSDQVTSWIATQPELVQIAFNESGTFLRSDEMLQTGFSGLGFSDKQIDQFFLDASKI